MHSLLADSIIAIAYFMVFPESNTRYPPPPPPPIKFRVKYHFHSAEIFFTNFLLYLFVLYIVRFQNSEIFITLTFLFVIQCFILPPGFAIPSHLLLCLASLSTSHTVTSQAPSVYPWL